VAGGRVTAAQVEAQLARQIAPRGPATRIASTLVRGETILPFTALEAGRAVVGWYLVSGRRAVLVARGTRGFPGARAATITVRLTAAGRRALTGARRVRLTARGTFAPTGRAVLRATRTFVLTR
jgi:hypothetical protein